LWEPPYEAEEEEEEDEREVVDGRKLKAGWWQYSDDTGDFWYEGPNGATSWTPPFADSAEPGTAAVAVGMIVRVPVAAADDRTMANGRKLRAGWRRFGPDKEGDIVS